MWGWRPGSGGLGAVQGMVQQLSTAGAPRKGTIYGWCLAERMARRGLIAHGGVVLAGGAEGNIQSCRETHEMSLLLEPGLFCLTGNTWGTELLLLLPGDLTGNNQSFRAIPEGRV